jgi:hypothetical protein
MKGYMEVPRNRKVFRYLYNQSYGLMHFVIVFWSKALISIYYLFWKWRRRLGWILFDSKKNRLWREVNVLFLGPEHILVKNRLWREVNVLFLGLEHILVEQNLEVNPEIFLFLWNWLLTEFSNSFRLTWEELIYNLTAEGKFRKRKNGCIIYIINDKGYFMSDSGAF